MGTRRDFLKKTALLMGGVPFAREFLTSVVDDVKPESRKVPVPPGTSRDSLVDKNPADLDAGKLEITPLEEFRTMGLDSHKVDPTAWRLSVSGRVRRPIEFTYEDLLALPPVERKVLLICPGIFVNQGLWRGFSVTSLLEKAGIGPDVIRVTFLGPSGPYAKVLRVPLAEVRSNKVFLAFGVNGHTLPVKHGFPLRLVAEGYYGYDWVKYVDRVTADGESD
ncbi:molybdopterin-dependent oxidoreductase [Thermodesulfobacteriota bacterium]